MGGIFSCFGNVLVAIERMSFTITCAALVLCLVITLTIVMALGIGLGYNYCFVDMRTRLKYVPAHYIYPGSPRWPYGRSPDVARYRPSVLLQGAGPYRRDMEQEEGDGVNKLKEEFDTEYQERADLDHERRANAMLDDYNYTNLTTYNRTIYLTNNTVDDTEDDDIEVVKSKSTEDHTLTEEQSESKQANDNMLISLNEPELMAFLSKLRADNKNYTLQVLST
ncbi:uncharacterized protein LOC142978040 [Anticarsia gemmatalis]|uniref:uncharacterized protein LOC142978040 n=1 Tax=Anticarsia gemmatalis TaxID=129554 RepID=UPI003F761187